MVCELYLSWIDYELQYVANTIIRRKYYNATRFSMRKFHNLWFHIQAFHIMTIIIKFSEHFPH
jgi:hypothetical protein